MNAPADDPDSLSDVRGVLGTSRNSNRPPGVAVGFQVSEHLVESQRDVTNNIFSKYPSGSDFANNSAHLRPEVARVFRASLLAGMAEWLTRVAACDDPDVSDSVPSQSVCCNGVNVLVAGNIGPVLSQDGAGERFDFTEGDGSHSGSFQTKADAADSAE